MTKKTEKERLYRFSVSDAGCWEWSGSKLWNGYGNLHPIRGEYLAHRASYAFHKGAIPEGLLILHSCDNRLCINPKHLSVGTHADNQREAYARNRRPTYPGSANANAKLTELQVGMIRLDTRTQQVIADEYGVSTSLISAIKTGKAWRTRKATERAQMNLR